MSPNHHIIKKFKLLGIQRHADGRLKADRHHERHKVIRDECDESVETYQCDVGIRNTVEKI